MNRKVGDRAILVVYHRDFAGFWVFNIAAEVIVCYFFQKFHFRAGVFIYEAAESGDYCRIVRGELFRVNRIKMIECIDDDRMGRRGRDESIKDGASGFDGPH